MGAPPVSTNGLPNAVGDTNTRQEMDANNNVIMQGFQPGVAHHVTFTSANGTIATAITAGTDMVEIIATQPCHYRMGTTTDFASKVTPNDCFIPANVPVRVAVRANVNIGVIGIVGGTNGTLHINELL